ncbi:MAG TPA: hypothetical protein VFA77_16715 [Candidatus Eisenbacteria bacterium]|nr:hypothetical protein [Candidatus Eisenbacteria bacterium]
MASTWRRVIEAQPRLAPLADWIERKVDLPGSVKTFTTWLTTRWSERSREPASTFQMKTPALFQAAGWSLQVCFTDAARVTESAVLTTRKIRTPRTNSL